MVLGGVAGRNSPQSMRMCGEMDGKKRKIIRRTYGRDTNL